MKHIAGIGTDTVPIPSTYLITMVGLVVSCCLPDNGTAGDVGCSGPAYFAVSEELPANQK